MSGRKLEINFWMTFDPMIYFGFMRVQIVHNHMEFLIEMFSKNFIHHRFSQNSFGITFLREHGVK